jgi:CDP-diacylglycerol---serine O-phosphatidyltransferase
VQDRNDVAAGEKLSTSNGLVTPRDGQSLLGQGLAFKSFEIEELADVYFFRPLGSLIARGARALRITPIGLTLLGTLIGITGGVLLYDERCGLLAFALLISYGIIDSADGQLARMTGRVTELGRLLDGAGGYVTHVAIYLAIAAGVIQRGGSRSILIWMLLAGIANAVQAQMYDYHRTTYIAVVGDGRAAGTDHAREPAWARWLLRWYLMTQRWLTGLHAQVETELAARSVDGRVREEDRARYREYFYRLVRGWNLLGDNTRFYAIGVLVCLQRIDLFFAFVLLPMNLALIALWLWQASADRKLLANL